ncbi:protein wech-like isoform X2 [Anneissia japonica]|nr:protein wech-like isoform X2 [Anneissia japonica]
MEEGKLTCPTCLKSYPIPEGGLQKLPPNTFLNNLLETIEQFSERDQIKCVCENEGQPEYYCQDCRKHLCSTCSDHHKILPMSENHKLHSVEDMQSMTPLQIAALHPPMCSIHDEPLSLFCCNIPICMHCTITVHNAWEGNHKPISISKAYESSKKTLESLKKSTHHCKSILYEGLIAIIENSKNLDESTDKGLRDIDEHVQTMINQVKKNGEKMKNELQMLYKKKKKINYTQKDELTTKISDIDTKLGFLNQLLKSDKVTVIQSSETVITALNERINELPKTEPNDNGQIYFFKNKSQLASLQLSVMGYVSHMRAADYLTLKGPISVTQGQTITVYVIKTDECEIHENQLKAKWTQPTGETNIAEVQECSYGNGKFFVTGKCTSPGFCKIYVTADGEQIKKSPMIIKVEKVGLVKTIDIYNLLIYPHGTKYQRHMNVNYNQKDDCLLVSCGTNEILKYKQSGAYIGKVTLPKGMRVNRMYIMKNGNIAFSDFNNKCIMVCDNNGQVIKSIGQGILTEPAGIYVDEASKLVYVADEVGGLFMFDFVSGQMIRKIGPKNRLLLKMNGVTDVTLTNQGNLLALEFAEPHRLQLFDNEGRFIKVLVEAGYENGEVRNPRRIVVDLDDNIIILSKHKLQLLSDNGSFIKRIDKQEDGINGPMGLCIISYCPRRVAVANSEAKFNPIQIFNY